MNVQEIINFNTQQIKHIKLVQQLVLNFCNNLMTEVLKHDESKFSEIEYATFVESRQTLNQSKDGKDEGYQKYLQSEAIQHHINNNSHHPEYWDRLNKNMPLEQVIIMFFDWKSRSIDRGTDFKDFLPYNLDKLKNQPRAKAVVELLCEYTENAQ